jgi:alkylhydroperoxidase family enzyme
MNGTGYLRPADPSADFEEQARDERERLGFVMNATRVWAHLPGAKSSLFALMEATASAASLTFRQRAVLVTTTATSLGDPYCSLAWGTRLAGHAGIEVATSIIHQEHDRLAEDDRVLADWARAVAGDPTATTAQDVDRLREAGFADEQIFALTAYIALRVAFAIVNDSLGAQPDEALVARAPEEICCSLGL